MPPQQTEMPALRTCETMGEMWGGAGRCGEMGLQPCARSMTAAATPTPTPTPTTHVGDGLQAVVVGSGGDDLGVVLARGVEVMVVGVEARVLELHRLANGWVGGK